MDLVLTLLINITMAVILMVTIWYCSRLNKRIQALQDARSELATIIKEFDESTQRATQSIADIHKATQRLTENMQHKIDKANFLADDLQFLIERSAKVMDKSDGNAGAARSNTASARTASHTANETPRPVRATPTATNPGVEEASADKRRAGLRMRSRTEQDLMDSLKSNES